MVHIHSFVKALKISWLKRIYMQAESKCWFNLSQIDFSKVFSLGGAFAAQQSITLTNPFWRELMNYWSDFCKTVKVDTIQQILESPLWFNNHLGIGQVGDWYKKGVRLIYDFINENGEFYEFESFKEKYGVRGTFLDYEYVLNRIPNEWKTKINDNKKFSIENKLNVTCNIYLSYITNSKKGCRLFYEILAGVNDLNSHDKWRNEIGVIQENDWHRYHSSLQKIKEVKLKDFQFKINNRILVTNSFLWTINKIDSNLCGYCKENIESIYHLFITCPKVKEFWNTLNIWLNVNANINLILQDRNILFSAQSEQELINYIFVLAKYYIYKNKFTDRLLNIQAFIFLLKKKFISEQFIAYIHNSTDKFLKKWSPLRNYFFPNSNNDNSNE